MSGLVEPSLLVPALRKDLNMRALETLHARVGALDLGPTVIHDLDQVHESALIHLAEQFNVLGDAGWDMASNAPDAWQRQRALLKEAVALHRIKGTPYAVRRALELLGVRATLTEWFQSTPAGQPGTFGLDALVTEQPAGAPVIDAARSAQIARVVNFWKPASRHFTLRVGLEMRSRLRMAAVFSGSQCLHSHGALLPIAVSGSLTLRTASLISATQLLVSGGTLQP